MELVVLAITAFVVGVCCLFFPTQLAGWHLPRARRPNPNFDPERAAMALRIVRTLGAVSIVLGVVFLFLR